MHLALPYYIDDLKRRISGSGSFGKSCYIIVNTDKINLIENIARDRKHPFFMTNSPLLPHIRRISQKNIPEIIVF